MFWEYGSHYRLAGQKRYWHGACNGWGQAITLPKSTHRGDKQMDVTVIGTGYVGLVTGAIFSIQGHNVTCVDNNKQKIDDLWNGILPIYEPGLEEIVKDGVNLGCLHFTTDASEAVKDADVVFLAVGTPQDKDGAANLEYLIGAAESIACAVRDDAIVVIKSTVPVGTNQLITDAIEQQRGRKIEVANNPEFLKEGTAIDDCLNPDRIVLGVRSERASETLHQLYAPLTASTSKHCPVLTMEPESAEMTKYAANCMLAMKISFINEIANLCEQLGADVNEVREGMCSDTRIGWEFLNPGAGYGGSCFPKDVRALISQGNRVGYDAQMLKTTDAVNEQQKNVVAEKVLNHFDGNISGKRIAVWGLAFKPGTDDIREAPALTVIDQLLSAGADVVVHDPEAMDNVQALLGDRVEYCDNKNAAIRQADALVVMTNWDEYTGVEPGMLRWNMNDVVVFDGRNCINRDWFAYGQSDYYSIGQAPLLRQSTHPMNAPACSASGQVENALNGGKVA